MMAGRLTEFLELYDMEKSVGDFGSGEVRYTRRETAPVHAGLRRQSGKSRMSGGEVFSAYDAEFEVRVIVAVKEGDRVKHLTGMNRLYRVDNILPHHKRGMNILQCSKVNE